MLRLTFAYGTATTDNGNLTSQTIAAPSFSQTQYYGYDGVNRLKAASEGAALVGGLTCPTTQSWCQEYGYEAFGNRWVSFSNRTLHMATPTSAANFNASTNRLTGSGITYDNAGNLTAHPFITPGGSITYNASNKMTQFTATGVSVAYRYDAQERRVRQDSAGQTTIWVYDAFGQLAAEYATNLTMVEDVYYRTTDHLGSTRIVTNQTAAVVQRRDFFPFGEAIPADSSHGNRHLVSDSGQATYNTSLGVNQQFTAQQRDQETGLDYFWARNVFSPIGRFLSVDPSNTGARLPMPQSWNAYTYVRNSPLSLLDPTGLVDECVPSESDPNQQICRPSDSVPGWPGSSPPGPPTEPDPYECDLRGGENPACPQYGQIQYGKVLAAAVAANPQLPDIIRRKLMSRMMSIVGRAARRARGLSGAVGIALTLLDVNQFLGTVGEYVVADMLVTFGFEIIGSQVTFHTALGDRRLDYIARDPKTGEMFGVEVKTLTETSGLLGSANAILQSAKDGLIAAGRSEIVGANAPPGLEGSTSPMQVFWIVLPVP